MDQTRARMNPLTAGFTIIELMIALTLIALLLGIAAPSFREALMNVRMTGAANDLMSDLSLARSEAAKLNVPVYLCSSTNGTTCNGTNWRDGWILFADSNNDGSKAAGEPVVRARPALPNQNTISLVCGETAVDGAKALPYRPTGLSSAGGAVFTLCDGRATPNSGRIITINVTGRPAVSRTTCPPAVKCP
jgi:type IV fimbrial biogenesis protein FimT